MKMREMFPVVAGITGKNKKVVEGLGWKDLQKALEISTKIMAEKPGEELELPVELKLEEPLEDGTTVLLFCNHVTAGMMGHIPVNGQEDQEDQPQEEPLEITEWPHIMPLAYPVPLGTETKTELTFRNKLRAGMVGDMDVGGTMRLRDLFPIISKMTGETTVLVERLRWCDAQAAMKVVGHFLGSGQKTGGD